MGEGEILHPIAQMPTTRLSSHTPPPLPPHCYYIIRPHYFQVCAQLLLLLFPVSGKDSAGKITAPQTDTARMEPEDRI